MELPDGRPLLVDKSVLAEDASGDGRIVLWVPDARGAGPRRWDRVGVAAGSLVAEMGGVRSVAAVLTPTRQRTGIQLPGILRGLVRSKLEPTWTRTDGGTCVRSGARRTDLVLAWPQDEADTLSEDRIRGRWPSAREVRRIGPNLVLVFGIPPETVSNGPEVASELPTAIPARQLAAHALAEARQAGDRAREVTALIDLAVSYLNKLDAQPAIAFLEEALAGARRLGDQVRELDALVNLGQAAILLDRPEEAIEWLGPALDSARVLGDGYTEKVTLERLGLAHQGRGDHARALDHFEQALVLARRLGDAQHVAMLLWHAGVAQAALGRPEQAVDRGEEAVGLLRRLGKPQSDEYARQLAHYRSSLAAPPTSMSRGFFDATVITAGPQSQSPSAAVVGPGLLQMARSATKAAVEFAGSGFKTVTRDLYRARMAACSRCELFTGVRCRACGCISAAKARLPHENCPAGRRPS